MIRLALYEPDIPQNTGTVLRLGACLGVAVDVIEPCGFPWDDKKLRRSGMDYLAGVELTRHASWARFQAAPRPGRLVLLTTQGSEPYHRFAFRPDDTLLLGRESAGVPADIHAAADARIVIPQHQGMRSLNLAVAAAMALGEALRQTDQFPASQFPAGPWPHEART